MVMTISDKSCLEDCGAGCLHQSSMHEDVVRVTHDMIANLQADYGDSGCAHYVLVYALVRQVLTGSSPLLDEFVLQVKLAGRVEVPLQFRFPEVA
jgi:hypothetical protein